MGLLQDFLADVLKEKRVREAAANALVELMGSWTRKPLPPADVLDVEAEVTEEED